MDQWAENYYEDEIYQNTFSSEHAPFLYTNDTPSIRFANLSHEGYHDYEETIDNYKKTQFHCYLYNIYDSYDDGDFTGTDYDGKENDDVSDIADDLFDYIYYISYPQNNIDLKYRLSMDESSSLFHSGFKSFLNDSDLGLSLDKIKDFIYDDDQEDPPPMKSAQVGSYNGNPLVSYGSPGLSLYWGSRSYDDTYYDNYETGYKVYSWNGSTSSWDLEETYDNETFAHLISSSCYCPNCPGGTWKVTSYNDEGESYDPLSHTFTCAGMDKISEYDHSSISIFKILNLYPNPTSNLCRIEYSIPIDSYVTFVLYDINGNQLFSDSFQTVKTTSSVYNLNLPVDLSSGSYFIRFLAQTDDGLIHIESIEMKILK